MNKLLELKAMLKPGEVYRREDLSKWSNAVDRHLKELLEEGFLQKVSQGLYYAQEETVFGKTPPEEYKLVRAFLKDHRFLMTSSNVYNSLGVGTTQLYNERIVYNRKRHGVMKLGNRTFYFWKKAAFPLKATIEFLLVDLVNNLDKLAEDQVAVMDKVKSRVREMDKTRMKKAVSRYGDVKTIKLLYPLLN